MKIGLFKSSPTPSNSVSNFFKRNITSIMKVAIVGTNILVLYKLNKAINKNVFATATCLTTDDIDYIKYREAARIAQILRKNYYNLSSLDRFLTTTRIFDMSLNEVIFLPASYMVLKEIITTAAGMLRIPFMLNGVI